MKNSSLVYLEREKGLFRHDTYREFLVAREIAGAINQGKIHLSDLLKGEWAKLLGVSGEDGTSSKDWVWRGGKLGKEIVGFVIGQITSPAALEELISLALEGDFDHNIVSSEFSYQGPKFMLFTENLREISQKGYALRHLEVILTDIFDGKETEYSRYGPARICSFMQKIAGRPSGEIVKPIFSAEILKPILMKQLGLAKRKTDILGMLNRYVGANAFLEGLPAYLEAVEKAEDPSDYFDIIEIWDKNIKQQAADMFFEFMQSHSQDKAIIVARDYCGLIKNYAPFYLRLEELIGLVRRFIEILERDDNKNETMHKCSAYVLLGLSKPAVKWASSKLPPKVLSSISEEAASQLVEGYVLNTTPIIYAYPGDLVEMILLLPDSENYISKASERLRQVNETCPEKRGKAEEILRYLSEKCMGFHRQRIKHIWAHPDEKMEYSH